MTTTYTKCHTMNGKVPKSKMAQLLEKKIGVLTDYHLVLTPIREIPESILNLYSN
jgi:hypothetical protein